MNANRESARPVGLNGRAWLQQWRLPKRDKCTACAPQPMLIAPEVSARENREPDPTTGNAGSGKDLRTRRVIRRVSTRGMAQVMSETRDRVCTTGVCADLQPYLAAHS